MDEEMLVGGFGPAHSAHKGEGQDSHVAHYSRSAQDGAPLAHRGPLQVCPNAGKDRVAGRAVEDNCSGGEETTIARSARVIAV